MERKSKSTGVSIQLGVREGFGRWTPNGSVGRQPFLKLAIACWLSTGWLAAGGVVVPLATDPNQSASLSQGFNTANDHTGNQTYAVDISVPDGTAILAPSNGYVVYSRYANGGLKAACGVGVGAFVPNSGNTIRRDDNLGTSNALWTATFWDPSSVNRKRQSNRIYV